MTQPQVIRVWRSMIGNPRVAIIGHCRRYADGWRFYPNVASHRPSRRYWPTWEECLPRWTGGLDSTSSEIVR
jgi:hypothetical protein